MQINNSDGVIAGILDSINGEQNISNSPNDTFRVFTENIVLYRFLTLTLIDPKGNFEIKPIHDSDRQEIDLDEGNRWDWIITTKTSDKTGLLILKVKAEKPDRATTQFRDRQIPIVIEIDNSSVLRQIWIYLTDHPEYILGAIFLPIIGYFSKKLIERKKKGES